MTGGAQPADARQPLRLGLQQALIAIPSIVTLPLLIGLDAGAALLCAGAGTLLFQLATRSRVPVVLGSSYSFAALLVSAAATQGSAHAAGAAALAGVVFASAAFGLRLVPPPKLRKLLPAHVTATAVLVLALALAAVAVQGADGGTAPAVVDRVGAWGAWLVAAVSLVAGISARLAGPRWRLAAELPIVAAIVAGTLVALPLGIFDSSALLKAPWIGLPRFSLPRISPPLIVAAITAGLVAAVEHVVDLLAIETVMGDDYLADRTVPRALLAAGGATVLSALAGGPPLAVSSESVGVAAVTGRRDPLVIRWAALAMAALAFLPKAAAAVASLPRVVIGGISILLFGSLCVRAVRRLVSARAQIAEPRIGLVVALMLVLGVGGAQLPLGAAGVSGAALALLVGVAANALLSPDPASRGARRG